MTIPIISYYALFINALLFILMGRDKYKAQKRKRRTSESTLFTIALIGGALGGWIGMYTFRHKTKHITFTLGFPMLLLVHGMIIYFLFFNE